MLANWIRSGLASGRVTSRYPKRREQLQQHAGWHTVVQAVKQCDSADCLCSDICPTGAVVHVPEDVPVVDVGACIGCGHCVARCPGDVLTWTTDIDLAVTSREQLVVPTGGKRQ